MPYFISQSLEDKDVLKWDKIDALFYSRHFTIVDFHLFVLLPVYLKSSKVLDLRSFTIVDHFVASELPLTLG